MKNSVSQFIPLAVGSGVLLICMGAFWLYYHKTFSNVEANAADTNGAIFTVATSTGETYFTVTSDGKVGIGRDTSDPVAALDVAGAIRLTKKSPDGCLNTMEGSIAYNPDNKHFWGCDGTQWRLLDK